MARISSMEQGSGKVGKRSKTRISREFGDGGSVRAALNRHRIDGEGAGGNDRGNKK